MRILMVEEFHEIANAYAQIFRTEGHEVVVAYSGEMALGVLDEFDPDVIVSDLTMQGMDGWELCRRLREDRRFVDKIIVAFSGWTEAAEVATSLLAGFNAHICKPARPNVILTVIGEIMSVKNDG